MFGLAERPGVDTLKEQRTRIAPGITTLPALTEKETAVIVLLDGK